MISYMAPLRLSALAGASALVLTLAMPVMAGQSNASSMSSTVNGPQVLDAGQGYRLDPARKTAGEREQQMATGGGSGGGGGGGDGDGGGGHSGDGGTGTGTGSNPTNGTPSGTDTPGGSVDGAASNTGGTSSPGTACSEPGRTAMGSAGACRNGSSGMAGQGGTAGSVGTAQIDRVRIQDLPPSLQEAARSRMDRQQTQSELVKTTILNRLAMTGSDYTLDSARKDGSNYVLFVTNPSGQQATMLYETTSGNLREVQM